MSRWRHECLHLVIVLLLSSSIGRVKAAKNRDSFSTAAATNASTESITALVANSTLLVIGGGFQSFQKPSSGTALVSAVGESKVIGNDASGPPQGVTVPVSSHAPPYWQSMSSI